MNRNLHIILISILTFSIISCGEDSNSPTSAANSAVSGASSSGSDGTNGKNSLISTTTESSGANCTTGGLKVQSGLDSDVDGVLDSNEVTSTTYVCNGSSGIKPSVSLYCGALLENTTLYFTYTAMVFSDSSVYAHASIYGVAYEIGASKFYDSSQNGASTAAIIFTYDVDGTNNGGWWQISVNRSTSAATIVYKEANVSGANATTWTLPSSSSNCVLNSY